MKSNSGGRSVGEAEVDEAFDGESDDGRWGNITFSEEVKEFFFLLEEEKTAASVCVLTAGGCIAFQVLGS